MRSVKATLQQTLTLESDLQSTQHIDDLDMRYRAKENIGDVHKRHKNSLLLEEYSKRRLAINEKREGRGLDGYIGKVAPLDLHTLDLNKDEEHEEELALMDQLLDCCHAEDCTEIRAQYHERSKSLAKLGSKQGVVVCHAAADATSVTQRHTKEVAAAMARADDIVKQGKCSCKLTPARSSLGGGETFETANQGSTFDLLNKSGNAKSSNALPSVKINLAHE